MKIDKKIAEGVIIDGKDFELVVAERKPNADTKIIREFWFKGKAKDLIKLKGGQNE